jgi:monomeric isocitrate dehydrogenase
MKAYHDENLKERAAQYGAQCDTDDCAVIILNQPEIDALKAACDLLRRKKDVTEVERETCRSILIGLPGGWPKR